MAFKLTLCLSLVALSGAAPAMEQVFHYSSESGDQTHHMSMDLEGGVPSVEGGWKFLAGDGVERELTYKADEMGFQPAAEYLPKEVEETKEVAEAKANFRTLYDSHYAHVKKVMEEDTVKRETAKAEAEAESEVVSVEKRSVVEPEEAKAEVMDDMMEDLVETLDDQLMVESRTSEVKVKMGEEKEEEEEAVKKAEEQMKVLYPYYYATSHGGYHYAPSVYHQPQYQVPYFQHPVIPQVKYQVAPAVAVEKVKEEETPYSAKETEEKKEVEAIQEIIPMKMEDAEKEEVTPVLLKQQFFPAAQPIHQLRYPAYYYPMLGHQAFYPLQQAPVQVQKPVAAAEEVVRAEETPEMEAPAVAAEEPAAVAAQQQQIVSVLPGYSPFYQPVRVIYPGFAPIHQQAPIFRQPPMMVHQQEMEKQQAAAMGEVEEGYVPFNAEAMEEGAITL